MKFFISIVVTGMLAFACGLYLPWWSEALASFIVAALIHQRPARSFLTGFIAVLILWLVLILMIDAANDYILSTRIGMVLGMGPAVIILLSCIIGALVAGLGALTGSLLRRTFV